MIVDQLSKYAHFMALAHLYFVIFLAMAFYNIIKLHGIAKSIVSDKDIELDHNVFHISKFKDFKGAIQSTAPTLPPFDND